MDNKVGRPREFRNAAEKQKAYRERKIAQEKELELAFAIIDEMEALEIALRNSWKRQIEKGRKPTIVYRESKEGFRWMALHVDGNFWSTWNPTLFRFLSVKGCLTKVASTIWDDVYELGE